MSETEQLREVGTSCVFLVIGMLRPLLLQDLKILEEDVEKSLAREEAMLTGEHPPSPSTPSLDDIQALQRSYKDLKSKYEVNILHFRLAVNTLTNLDRPRLSSSERSLQISR